MKMLRNINGSGAPFAQKSAFYEKYVISIKITIFMKKCRSSRKCFFLPENSIQDLSRSVCSGDSFAEDEAREQFSLKMQLFAKDEPFSDILLKY